MTELDGGRCIAIRFDAFMQSMSNLDFKYGRSTKKIRNVALSVCTEEKQRLRFSCELANSTPRQNFEYGGDFLSLTKFIKKDDVIVEHMFATAKLQDFIYIIRTHSRCKFIYYPE